MEIYKITNIKTQDFYIGSAVNYKNRRWSHICSLKKNKHKNQFIQNSWNKYGQDAFIFEIIEVVDKLENLIIREQYWIDTLSPTFNFAKIAGSPLGVKHTEKSRMNMSIAHQKLTKEERGHKENCICAICNRKKGKDSPRYIPREERICVCGCGISFTCMINSNKRFISGHNKSQLGRKKTREEIEKQRKKILVPILQYDMNGKFIKEWEGIIVAANELNYTSEGIIRCLKGKAIKYKNCIWKYKFKS
jgi:group I intron endonuclease